jgi:hypothetical protein
MSRKNRKKRTATKQAVKSGWRGDPTNINREGKGGFQDHPENRADGRWSKEDSYSYWLHKFLAMSYG